MLNRLRQAGLVWPTLAALAGLGVLVALGNWQLERKRWKEDLLAKIAAGAKADPILISPLDPVLLAPFIDKVPDPESVVVLPQEYTHVAMRGRFHHDKEQYLYAPAAGGLGWHVYTPLELVSQRVVWVNRGFVPDAKKAPEARPQGQVAGEVEVRGLVRFPRKGMFTPNNDVQNNLWYWPDLSAMTAAAFPEAAKPRPGRPQEAKAWPLVIAADARPEPPGGLPRGGVTRLELPNRHLEYAITWYGLALTLIGVYFVFAVNRLRMSTGA